MESVFELGSDLDQIIIVEIDLFLALIACAHVDLPVGEAEVVGGSSVEVPFDGEGLEDEGSFEACADVDDCVIGK